MKSWSMKKRKRFLIKDNLPIHPMRFFLLLQCVYAFTKVNMLKTNCANHALEMQTMIERESKAWLPYHYIMHSTIVNNYSCISYITFTDNPDTIDSPMIPSYLPNTPTMIPSYLPSTPTMIPSHLPTSSPTL
jgi:hypothetical protein